MYILKNALRCISRAKGRNLLIGLVVLLLSVSSCIGLSIKEANRTLKKQYADDKEITATLNAKDMRKSRSVSLEKLKELSDSSLVKEFQYTSSVYFAAGDGIEPLDVAGSFKQNKDFKDKYGDIKNGESKTETETETKTESSSSESESSAASKVESTVAQKTSSITAKIQPTALTQNEGGETGTESVESGTEPPEEGTESGGEESGKPNEEMPSRPDSGDSQKPKSDGNGKPSSGGDSSNRPQMPEGGFPSGGPDGSGKGDFITNKNFITNNFFFNMGSMNDFTVTAYNTDAAMPEYLSSLNALSESDETLNCLISKSLAEENDLKKGSTFTLKNPDNEDETYTFTVAGIFDSSQSSDSQDTSSNASFTDNYIYISNAALQKLLADSAKANPETEEKSDKEESEEEETTKALSANYSGTFIFANLNDYNQFNDSLGEDYTLVSNDVENYTQSVSQLETLGQYATYFLVVIFVIGAFVLVIINLFSIRNRKYEIGVLTAIGMKKWKVAIQFVVELFVVTFAALIIGSSIGSVASVPVTNKLLVSINTEQKAEESTESKTSSLSERPGTPPSMPGSSDGSEKMTPPGNFGENFKNKMGNVGSNVNKYIASISSATDMTVILEMILVGMGLTLISSAAAVAFVMRYEPLKILNNRD